MATAKTTVTFSDLDLTMIINPTNGDIVKVINAAAINRSIQALIFSNMYDHPFRPDITSPIGSLLFQSYSPDIGNILEKVISSLLNNFEPRIQLLDVSVDAAPQDNSLSATIIYQIVNNPAPITFNVLLKRLR